MHTQTTLCVMLSVESVATLIAAKIHVNFSVVVQGTKTANSCHVMQQDNCSVVFHRFSGTTN